MTTRPIQLLTDLPDGIIQRIWRNVPELYRPWFATSCRRVHALGVELVSAITWTKDDGVAEDVDEYVLFEAMLKGVPKGALPTRLELHIPECIKTGRCSPPFTAMFMFETVLSNLTSIDIDSRNCIEITVTDISAIRICAPRIAVLRLMGVRIVDENAFAPLGSATPGLRSLSIGISSSYGFTDWSDISSVSCLVGLTELDVRHADLVTFLDPARKAGMAKLASLRIEAWSDEDRDYWDTAMLVEFISKCPSLGRLCIWRTAAQRRHATAAAAAGEEGESVFPDLMEKLARKAAQLTLTDVEVLPSHLDGAMLRSIAAVPSLRAVTVSSLGLPDRGPTEPSPTVPFRSIKVLVASGNTDADSILNLIHFAGRNGVHVSEIETFNVRVDLLSPTAESSLMALTRLLGTPGILKIARPDALLPQVELWGDGGLRNGPHQSLMSLVPRFERALAGALLRA